ncbi:MULTISPECIES: hypothetical protein [unclassified Nocardiopsis]
MHRERVRALTGTALHDAICDWTCRLCTHSNPEDEDICCQRCGASKP